MRFSQLIGQRFKQRPSEALLDSHAILLRGGYIRQVANGIYSLLPTGVRVIKKIEQIIREEMDRIGGQEVLMPVVLPRELWEESGRYESVGSELLRFKDRTGHDMLLAMTHEEGVVHLARSEVNSYRQYPFMLYQIQTKFRDEPRSRGGLVRVREFTMKDAYSFHTDEEDLENYYRVCAEAYHRIFARAGLPHVKQVQSDTGMMGGRTAHEYMLPTEAGEDTIVTCSSCDYIANLEVAESRRSYVKEPMLPLEKDHTPGRQTIAAVSEFLSVPESRTAKAVFYEKDSSGKPVLVLIRGDLEVNEAKLGKLLQTVPEPASEKTIQEIGAVAGYASPIGLRNCRVLADCSIVESNNLVCGANEPEYHYKNYNLLRDTAGYETVGVAAVREGEQCPSCDGKLQFKRGIEVGNIFQLGTKYTEKMGMRYLDKEGKEHVPVMGCYGIGVGRLMASIIEAHHDDYGPVWPASVAPYNVHIVAINLNDEQKKQFPEPVYNHLRSMNIDTVYDDRNERPGVQFADADLIGAPLRLLFSAKNFDARMVEWKTRDNKEKGLVKVEDVLSLVKDKR